MDYKDWTYDDFITYLLIYASHADFIVTREEVRRIITETGRSEYNKINRIFEKQSDAEKAEVIAFFGMNHCTTNEELNSVLEQLQDLLFSDDSYKTEEQGFLFGVKKLLSAHN